MIVLPLREIADSYVRKSFEQILSFIYGQAFLKGQFQHFEVTFSTAATKLIPHRMGFAPEDIIQTSSIGAGSVTFNYSSFDEDNLSLTASGACVVRFYAGTHRELL
jgi:hypothetical protein